MGYQIEDEVPDMASTPVWSKAPWLTPSTSWTPILYPDLAPYPYLFPVHSHLDHTPIWPHPGLKSGSHSHLQSTPYLALPLSGPTLAPYLVPLPSTPAPIIWSTLLPVNALAPHLPLLQSGHTPPNLAASPIWSPSVPSPDSWSCLCPPLGPYLAYSNITPHSWPPSGTPLPCGPPPSPCSFKFWFQSHPTWA